jgi:membrane fusion protein (multidrug efflux system)
MAIVPRIDLALVLSTAAALGGCSQAQAQPGPAPPAEVGVITLEPRSVALSTDLPGRTTAVLVADVRPQVSGLLQKRIFTEGADVRAGQQLYQIDPATYQATYDTALATLAHNQAALLTAEAKVARYKPLADAQAVSRQDYDDALAASGEAVADIATAKASIEQARINLAYTRVNAPISGRIGRSAVTPGALVTAGQTTALATVTQLDPIYVDVTQPATTLLRLRRELADGELQTTGADRAKVKLLMEDGSTYPLPGVLQFSEVTVDEGTGTVLLRILFPNPDHTLLPGLYVRAELQEGTNDHALLVPQDAVSHNTHGDPTALVVGPDGKVELRTLVTDRTVGHDWVVTSGLAAGDRLIVDGLQKVAPGAVVRTIDAKTPAPAAPGQ